MEAPYSGKIADLEIELDSIWPGWRERQPFAHVPAPRKARIKWCLKRRLLLVGDPAFGSEPRDWPVVIVWKDMQPFAHPVMPDAGGVVPNPPEPPRVPPLPIAERPTAPGESAQEVAFRLRAPFERVELLMAAWVAAGRPDTAAEYVRRHLTDKPGSLA